MLSNMLIIHELMNIQFRDSFKKLRSTRGDIHFGGEIPILHFQFSMLHPLLKFWYSLWPGKFADQLSEPKTLRYQGLKPFAKKTRGR